MGGGNDINYTNPGSIDLQSANPQLYAEVQRLKGLQSQFDTSSMNAMNPMMYDQRINDSMARSDVNTANRYAQMGLAGSSAAMGAADESQRQLGFGWQDRRMNDMAKSMQIQQGLSQQIGGDVMQIQNQFGQTQNQVNQAMMQQNQQQQQMWGDIAKTGGMIAGMAIAGPAGAAAGGAAGGTLVGSPAVQAPSYMDNTYGQSMMNSANYNYGTYNPYSY